LFVAHPADADFLDFCNNLTSEHWVNGSSPVSRFVWEMDLALAREAGAAVENPGPFVPAVVGRPGVANAYFKNFQFASSWSYDRRPKVHRVAESRAGYTALEPGSRVCHQAFGPGRVDRWVDSRVVRVVFDNGDSRMLVASMAGLTIDVPARRQGSVLGDIRAEVARQRQQAHRQLSRDPEDEVPF
jgi:DNA helicase-2/ATP-dependent DNA helicase PcrA